MFGPFGLCFPEKRRLFLSEGPEVGLNLRCPYQSCSKRRKNEHLSCESPLTNNVGIYSVFVFSNPQKFATHYETQPYFFLRIMLRRYLPLRCDRDHIRGLEEVFGSGDDGSFEEHHLEAFRPGAKGE